MQRLLHILLLLLSLVGSVNGFAQETEAQLKEKADKLFEKQDYVAATPAFLQLLALQPRNPEYNYKYGTCLLFNSRKKSDAIKYLEFATASGTVAIEAFYYMGKAYHLNYQFEEAIKFYNLYKSNSRGKPNKELEVERQVEMCENGRKLLKKITDIVVLEKKEYGFNEFFALYDLKDFGGNIVVSSKDQSKLDKKKGHMPIAHYPDNARKVYFASYGENEENGKQIYVKRKLPEGGWSAPELVKGQVNTPYDEDFPYMDPSGEYLYFSSKGHNSMGGFDVFKSRYDAATNSFGLPENVDFAISSTDNDLFYIVDSLDQNAWFASARQSLDGKISVYKVRVERLASPIAAIAGTFSSTVHPDNKKFNIEVKDLASGRQIGTFYSQPDGSYLISLPKGGKYEYTIKITGSPQPFKAVVNVPVLNEFKPLKQQILHETENEKEVAKVINLFDQNVENAESILAQVLQMRSELNVNSSQFDLQSLGNPSGSKEVFAELGMQKLSPIEAKDQVTELAKSQSAQVKTLEEVQQKALGKVVSNATEIKSLQAEVKNKVNATNATSDPVEKYGMYVEAEQKTIRITELEQANQKLLKYSDSLSKAIQSENTQATAAKKLEQQLAQASDDAQIVKVIGDNKAQIKSLKEESKGLATEQLIQEIVKLKAERDQLTNSRNSYQSSADKLQQEVQALESKLSAAKAKDKPAIQSSIDSKQNELAMMKQEIQTLDKKIAKVNAPLEQKESQLEYLQNLQKENLPSKTLTVADAKKAAESTENQNYKTLKTYVAKEKADFEKNPAIAGKQAEPLGTGGTQENMTVAVKDHEAKLKQISNDPKLTEEERMQLAQAEDERMKRKVEEEIARVEQKTQQNPSDIKALETLKSLRETAQNIDQRMAERSETIEATAPKPEVSAEVIVKTLKPALDQKMDAIANNPNLSVIEQLKMAQNEELEFEEILSTEIAALESKIAQNPSDQKAKSQLKALQSMKAEVTENIDNRSLAIESLDPENGVMVEKPEQAEVLEGVKPGHEARLAEINANTTLSTRAKLQQSQQEDEKLQANVSTEIKRLEGALKKNPNDSKTQATYEALLEIQQETSGRIAERKALLDQPEIGTTPVDVVPTATDVVAKLKPDHEQKLAAISNDDLLSPQEKQQKLIQEEVKLQKALDAEIKKADKILAKDPANAQAVAEKAQLTASREESQNRADESKQLLVAEEKTAIKPNDLLFKTDKNYQLEVQKIENSDSPDKNAQLIAREKASQEILQAQIRKNESQLAKKEDPKLAAETQVLNELIDASQKRIETLGGTVENTQPEPVAVVKATDLRKEKLGANAGAMTDNPVAPEALKQQAQALTAYQSELETLIRENKAALAKAPADQSLKTQQEIYLSEQQAVAGKLSQVNAALQKTVVASQDPQESQPQKTATASEFSTHPDMQALQKEQAALQAQLDDPAVSERDKQALKKELAANEVKQVKVENSLMQEKIADQSTATSAEVEKAAKNLPADATANAKSAATIESIRKSEQTVAARLKEAKSEKDPAARQELLKQVASQQAANEAKLNDLKADQALGKAAASMQETDPNFTIYKLESTKDLESRRRRGIIEIGELTSQLERLDAEIKSSKRSAAKVLIAERDAKAAELSALQAEQSQVESELAARKAKPLSVYNEAAINENITYEEERRLASSEPYKQYAKTAQEAAEIQKSILKKETELETLRAESHLLIVKDADGQGSENQQQTAANLSRIAVLTQEINQEKTQLSEKKQTAEQIINQSEEAMKLQNLIARGVEPIKTLAVAATLIPLPSNGFEIVSNPRTAPVKTDIPVGVEVPSGLVYRVQVGAFAKPVKEELFKEFNPVSGEKLSSGITRYMAGYFNNRAAVLNARTQIQELGYADAFPVAYCDGQRISMQEARRLEESGQCVALGVESLMLQAAENVSQVSPGTVSPVIPGDTTKKAVVPASNPGAYNQAPGAAKAIAVETRPGLFYTVQVGVYNKPVPATQIKNMEPLITKRLANGQIRYSAGIFQTVEAAQPKKREAIARGINDAYITAYYKGERISLEEARKLLEQLGTSILEKENKQENKVIADERIRQIEKETQATAAKIEQQERIENAYKEDQIQFVSKKAYDEFPRDLLKRFNENGSFFYDATDHKIKSVVYKNEDYVPQVYYFRNEIDTVFLPKSDSLHKAGTFEVAARFTGNELTGAMGDWLIRLGYQREIRHVEDNKIQVRIFGIRDEATFDEVMAQMRALGFNVLMAGGN